MKFGRFWRAEELLRITRTRSLTHPGLWLAWVDGRPLHVVSAEDAGGGHTIIITVYEPDEQEWEAGFRRRRQQ